MADKADRRELLTFPVEFKPEITATLGHYVYVYTDPRTGHPFYIGKGSGNRAFAHLDDASETEKVARIHAIRKSGAEPRIDILRFGLTDSEAKLVEAASIDLIGIPPLLNLCRGGHSGTFGLISSHDLVSMLTAKPATIRHKAVLFVINQLYRSDMTAEELYEATRGIWKVGPKRESAELAMAVYQGVIREVYRIHSWQPAGAADYHTREFDERDKQGRWEFEGEVAADLRELYVGYSVRDYLGKSSQNPVRYVNM